MGHIEQEKIGGRGGGAFKLLPSQIMQSQRYRKSEKLRLKLHDCINCDFSF